ncbi:YwqH-like family protein [Sporosarcina psychrophila]|uniref:DUF5082 domain-containing protein n=1 Tax=Sporosarcina psychrophila TaxID=1476 RepID=A0ABV2K5E2_SPOPS
MLGYYYALLSKKEGEVARLNACQSSLSEKQQQFTMNEHKCLEPELSPTTWHGRHATDFQAIREGGIHTAFLEIAGAQFVNVYSAIAAKIASLQAEIASIQQTIERLLAEEAAREKEEVKTSN